MKWRINAHRINLEKNEHVRRNNISILYFFGEGPGVCVFLNMSKIYFILSSILFGAIQNIKGET